jgi:hypothetical protein
MVAALVLGTSAERRGGSSPLSPTTNLKHLKRILGALGVFGLLAREDSKTLVRYFVSVLAKQNIDKVYCSRRERGLEKVHQIFLQKISITCTEAVSFEIPLKQIISLHHERTRKTEARVRGTMKG